MKYLKVMFRYCAGVLANSCLFASARELWKQNQINWNIKLSKFDKLTTGIYLILSDFAVGKFPPRFDDPKETHKGEIDYRSAFPGVSRDEFTESTARAPFRDRSRLHERMTQFLEVYSCLEKCGITPPSRILELGCGTGWMAEFFALIGYSVCATTLSPDDVNEATRYRTQDVASRFPAGNLEYRTSAMETVKDAVKDLKLFDAVYVSEALHHAHDWKSTILSAQQCLRPGGWLLLCAEPNILHIFTSYRISKLTHAHEIGFSRRELVHFAKSSNFDQIVVLRNRCNLGFKSHWLAARNGL